MLCNINKGNFVKTQFEIFIREAVAETKLSQWDSTVFEVLPSTKEVFDIFNLLRSLSMLI